MHPDQEETFAVLEGHLRLRTGRRSCLLGAGDSATVQAGTRHAFSNPGPGPALVRVEVRPAMRMAELLEAAARLGPRPRPLMLARFLAEFAAEVRAPFLPGLVAGTARRLVRLAGEPKLS
ncbi:MAG: cupin domain-containing protein [Candidatus Dormibacterales bacterium]